DDGRVTKPYDSHQQPIHPDDALDADRLMLQSAVVLRLGTMMLAAGAGSYRVKSSMAKAAAAVGLDRHEA
ncbi:Membrane protein, partial [human gut metagenome]